MKCTSKKKKVYRSWFCTCNAQEIEIWETRCCQKNSASSVALQKRVEVNSTKGINKRKRMVLVVRAVLMRLLWQWREISLYTMYKLFFFSIARSPSDDSTLRCCSVEAERWHSQHDACHLHHCPNLDEQLHTRTAPRSLALSVCKATRPAHVRVRRRALR